MEGHDAQLQGCESSFLDLARAADMRSLGRATAHFRNLARADGRETARVPDGLYFSKTFANRRVLSGEFGDLAAETITTALDAYTDPPDTEDPRPTSERTAAAFVRICEVAIAHLGDERRPKAAVTMTVAWETITEGEPGPCDGVFTGPIHPDDMRKALCDCSVSRIVVGPKSEPLDVGRARMPVPPPMRRGLVACDRGCRFPGCIHPPGYCDAHHLVHWIDGGETSTENVALFCDRHHHVLHQGGWRAVLDGTTIRVYRPDGTEVTA